MEWGILNQPERLEDLSKRFLPNLRPTETAQFAQLDQASARLPTTYATAKLNHHTMLADNKHDVAEDSASLTENISLARNNVAPMPASVVSHEEDGGLESAISDLEKNDTQKHIRSLPVAQASHRSLDASYDKLLTAFQQNPSAQMPSEL
ncbi:inner-membrane translocator [Lasius niger]|uniref:Inner-membrane translocator n=1 Tax=Lasius niger TaxID=67767 RepID=A0A0J7NF39_LASNI|nr:inner-membrane translocator [Lasius niger]